jgi:hypothetical protein
MERVTEANTEADTADTAGAAATAATGDTVDTVDTTPQTERPRRRVDKTLLVMSFVIAIGLALVVRGLAVSITGDDRANLPDTIESVEPVPAAEQVLSQTRVFVDLENGYTGVLVIDGVELPTVSIDDVAEQFTAEPGQQVDLPATTIYEPGNATLTFTPSDDALVQKFETGVHRVQVIYWKVIEGRQRPRSYNWTFTAV